MRVVQFQSYASGQLTSVPVETSLDEGRAALFLPDFLDADFAGMKPTEYDSSGYNHRGEGFTEASVLLAKARVGLLLHQRFRSGWC